MSGGGDMNSNKDDPRKKDDASNLPDDTPPPPPPPPPPLLSARYNVAIDTKELDEMKNQQARMSVEMDAYRDLRTSLASITHYHFPFMDDKDSIQQFKVSLDNSYTHNVQLLTIQMNTCKSLLNNIRESLFDSVKEMAKEIPNIDETMLDDRIEKIYTDTKSSFQSVVSAKDVETFEKSIRGFTDQFRKNVTDLDKVITDLERFRLESEKSQGSAQFVESENLGAEAHKKVNTELYYQPGKTNREHHMFFKNGMNSALTDKEYESLPWEIQALNYIVDCLNKNDFKEAEKYAKWVEDKNGHDNLYKYIPYALHKDKIDSAAKVSDIFQVLQKKGQETATHENAAVNEKAVPKANPRK